MYYRMATMSAPQELTREMCALQVTVLVLVVTYAILKFRKASMDRDCQVRLQQALLCTVSGLQRLMNAYAWLRAGLQGHARGLP